MLGNKNDLPEALGTPELIERLDLKVCAGMGVWDQGAAHMPHECKIHSNEQGAQLVNTYAASEFTPFCPGGMSAACEQAAGIDGDCILRP